MNNSVIAAIENGRKIEAIKLLKKDAGLDLKEAKEQVEAYISSHPELKAALDAKRSTLNLSQQQLLNIVIIVIALILVYWLLW